MSLYPHAKKSQIYKGMEILLDNTFLSTLIQTKSQVILGCPVQTAILE